MLIDYRSLEEIRDDYNKGKYTLERKLPEKLPKNYVFDDNLTIKENNTMVEEYNAKVDSEIKKFREDSYSLFNKMRSEVVTFLMGDYDFSEAQANVIEGRAYAKEHSYMYDYFNCVEEYADLVDDVNREA